MCDIPDGAAQRPCAADQERGVLFQIHGHGPSCAHGAHDEMYGNELSFDDSHNVLSITETFGSADQHQG